MTTLSPLQYVTISDFTPGIWDRFNRIPAPLGAAQSSLTYGCIAQPAGGLGPLPRATGGTGTSVPVPDPTPRNAYYYVNGLKAVFIGTMIEVHIGITWIDAGTSAVRFRWYRYDGTNFIQVIDQTGAVQPDPWTPEAFTMAVTRLTSAGAPANISIVGSWANRTGAGSVWYFPDPGAPANTAPAADNTQRGAVYAHQSRILNFVANSANHGATYTSEMNELINYTDPPQSITLGTQATMLAPESPFGYGAWGSVSAGELVLVKIAGGGLMSYDDLVYPRVVRLPAIQSTGPVAQEGSFCSAGMLYYAHNNGIYAWNGNNTAQKISTQLRGDVFNPTYPQIGSTLGKATPPVLYQRNQYISHTNWRDRVMFPNHWMFDTQLNSWWLLEQLPDTSGLFDITYWSAIGNTLYGMKSHWTASTPQSLYQYVDTAGNGKDIYSWQSQFIPLGEGSQVSIHEVELTAIPTIAGSSVLVTLTAESGSTTTLTFSLTPVTGQPIKLIQQLDTPIVAYGLTIRLVSNSNSSAFEAPVINSVSIGTSLSRITGSSWR